MSPSDGTAIASPALRAGHLRSGSVVDVARIGGQLYIVATGQGRPSKKQDPQRVQRSWVRVFRLDRSAWVEPAPGNVAGPKTSTRGSALVEHRGRPCVFVQQVRAQVTRQRARGVRPRGQVSTIRLRCLDGATWTDKGRPITPSDRRGYFDAGSSIVAGGTPWGAIAESRIRADSSQSWTWRILRRTAAGWKDTPLSMTGRSGIVQGRLAAADGSVWAQSFEQTPLSRGEFDIAATIAVRQLAVDGTHAAQIGPALVDRRRLYGPTALGLAFVADTSFAMYSRPNDRYQRNDLRVARLVRDASR